MPSGSLTVKEGQPSSYVAVVDIGSNSVRLVVYSGRARVANTVFNEKSLCGLGAEIGETGRMGDKAVAVAKSTLLRYRALCDQMGVTDIMAVATAAMRDAENGSDLARWIEEDCGFPLRIISGDEEARLAGLGVISSDPQAAGIVGDLGGGSLELARIIKGEVHQTVSMPIGPLRLIGAFGSDKAAMRAHVRAELQKISWLSKEHDPTFYIVGGSWRNLAKLLMWQVKEPLPVLQAYTVRSSDMEDFAGHIAGQRPQDIVKGNRLSTRRLDVLPISALILTEVLRACQTEECAISTYGLREGLMYQGLSELDKRRDPYLFQCEDLAQERCRFPEHAGLLMDWTRSIFDGTALVSREKADRLHMAVCLLSDMAWRGHPDFRAERAVEVALHGQFVGISHKGRAFVAVALNQIYGASLERDQIAPVVSILEPDECREARILGAAIRLAQRLSGGAIPGLRASSLAVEDGTVILTILKEQANLCNEVVTKRLKALANLMDVDFQTTTSNEIDSVSAA